MDGCNTNPRISRCNNNKMNIDKIPIHMLNENTGEETYTLGTLTLTKAEYANAEKINEIIDYLNDMELR